MSDWSAQDLMVVSAARHLEDGRIIFAGVGLPMLAAMLARALQAPNLTVALEGGIVGPEFAPGRLPISTNEMRAARKAGYLTDITDVFLLAQRGFFDYGFLGAAQVDPYGNLNTSYIGDPSSPRVRLPGTGGANDIASLCTEIVIVTAHERRRFVDQVDFITSPGNKIGGRDRSDRGLRFGRVTRVITNLGLFDFEGEDGRMRLAALQPGSSRAAIRQETGFDVEIPAAVGQIEPPTTVEMEILRELDSPEQH